jgi:hypothetical protein
MAATMLISELAMSTRLLTSRTEGWPSLLRTWASIAAELRNSRSRAAPAWNPLHRMIEVARQKLAGDRERLHELLKESRKRLAPLEDPFDIDLGLHRWLDGEREETYSDWLEWVVRQTTGPAEVFKLFNLGFPPQAVLECRDLEVQRECFVPHGHHDQEGRLDLVIRYGDTAIIVIEVKTADAEGADTAKHGGYNLWLAEQNHPYKHARLLAVSAEDDTYGDFPFLSWASVCVEMRRLAVGFSQEGRVVTAAVVLAFVAAVEQNLLGFSARLVQDICKGRAVLFNAEVVDYMDRFINYEA